MVRVDRRELSPHGSMPKKGQLGIRTLVHWMRQKNFERIVFSDRCCTTTSVSTAASDAISAYVCKNEANSDKHVTNARTEDRPISASLASRGWKNFSPVWVPTY